VIGGHGRSTQRASRKAFLFLFWTGTDWCCGGVHVHVHVLVQTSKSERSESATSGIVSFSFHILFVKVNIDYIFHYHGYSGSLPIVCLLTVKIYWLRMQRE
jgi:hypothetical protein